MKPWQLAASAALVLLVVALARRRPDPPAPDDSSSASPEPSESADDDGPDWAPPAPDLADQVSLYLNEAKHAVIPTTAANMQVSTAGRELIRSLERLSLTRYRLGDGGYTIGWGRYYPDGGELPPERIDLATAELWFDEDIENRGARWVRAYVSVPITQSQFDALTSMAYNLRPKSFRQIADAVNAGADPEGTALQFVRAGTNLEAGLRRRRALELALYRSEGNIA